MKRSTATRAFSALSLLLVSVLPASAPAMAATTGTTYYQCTVNVSGNTNDCTNGIVTVTTSSGSQRVARVDLAPSFVRLDAFVDVCSPTGWWIHFADSPTCNGGGGDGGQTDHDAEAYLNGLAFEMFGMYNKTRSAFEVVQRSEGVAAASGCYRVQWTIYESRVLYDDDGNPADTPRIENRSVFGFESAPYAEPDGEDSSGADANRWYVGMNRTVGSSSRSGTGVTRACFVVSTTTSPAASLLSSLCP